MYGWHDGVTGTDYVTQGVFQRESLSHLRRIVALSLDAIDCEPAGLPAKKLADCVARFWADTYYDLVFPIRIGLCASAAPGATEAAAPTGTGKKGGSGRTLQMVEPFDAACSESVSGRVDLDRALEVASGQGRRFRSDTRHRDSLPPLALLPRCESTPGQSAAGRLPTDLVADRLLVGSMALSLLALRSGSRSARQPGLDQGLAAESDEARLGVLLSPFMARGLAEGREGSLLESILEHWPAAQALARALGGKLWAGAGGATDARKSDADARRTYPGVLADMWDVVEQLTDWIAGRHWMISAEGGEMEALTAALEDTPVTVVEAGIQRVQRYILEAPRLGEVRGASSLLEKSTAKLRGELSELVGPESVIRAAAGQVLFVAGTEYAPEAGPDGRAMRWDDYAARYLQRKALGTTVAAAQKTVTLLSLVSKSREVFSSVWEAVLEDRESGLASFEEALPFELRCSGCQRRAAARLLPPMISEGGAGGQPTAVEAPGDGDRGRGRTAVCEVCYAKSQWPYEEGHESGSRSLVLDLVYERVGAEALPLLSAETKAGGPPQAATQRLSLVESFDELPNPGARYQHTAVVVCDGNHFGRIVASLEPVTELLRWSRRVRTVGRTAVAYAMALALMEENAETRYTGFPYEVMTLGGDDMSFVTSGSLALRFASHLMEALDREYAGSFETRDGSFTGPVSYSLGVVISDAKAPVGVTSEWAEGEALRRAKAGQAKLRTVGASDEGGTTVPGGGCVIAFTLADSVDNLPRDWHTFENGRRNPPLSESYGTQWDGQYGLALDGCLQPVTSPQLRFLIGKADDLREHQQQIARLDVAFRRASPAEALLYYHYQKARTRARTEGSVWFDLLEGEDDSEWRRAFGLSANHLLWGGPDWTSTIINPLADLLTVIKATEVGSRALRGGKGARQSDQG